MGLIVADYAVPSHFAVEDLVTHLSERTGVSCSLRVHPSDATATSYTIGARAIRASVDLIQRDGLLRSEAIHANAYFLLQLELAVADLGGQRRGISDRQPRPPRFDHPHAQRTWRELPLRLRLASGPVGKMALGIVAILVQLLILVTLPLQLLVVPLVRWWKGRAG